MATSENSKGIIKIDGTTLPGYVKRLAVRGSIKIDYMDVQDRDAEVTQPAGYNPGDIDIRIMLSPDDGDVYTQAQGVKAMFRAKDGQVKPDVHTVTSGLINLHGISQVLFREFDTIEEDKTDGLEIWIQLDEYVPLETQIENQVIENQAGEAAEGSLTNIYDGAAAEIAGDGEGP